MKSPLSQGVYFTWFYLLDRHPVLSISYFQWLAILSFKIGRWCIFKMVLHNFFFSVKMDFGELGLTKVLVRSRWKIWPNTFSTFSLLQQYVSNGRIWDIHWHWAGVEVYWQVEPQNTVLQSKVSQSKVPLSSVPRGTLLYSVPEDRSPSWTTLTWLHSASSGVSRFLSLIHISEPTSPD